MLENLFSEKTLEPFYDGDGFVIVTMPILDNFLAETSDLELEPSERLRRLAITLEFEEFVDRWSGLRFIYDCAIQENPDNVTCYHSFAISALEWFEEDRNQNIEDRISIASAAEEKIKLAITKKPEDPDLYYTYGLLLYHYPIDVSEKGKKYIELALQQFKWVLELNQNHQMAALYKAHCLHDQGQWKNAFEAYSQVNSKILLEQYPNWQWRTLKMQEQMALCCARMGDVKHSTTILSMYLDTLESLNDEEAIDDVADLDDSVMLLTEIIENSELFFRLRKIIKRLDMEDFYQEELKT